MTRAERNGVPAAKPRKNTFDLLRQFARRRQHQRAGHAAWTCQQLVHDGQQERGSLASTSLGNGHEVTARANGWNRLSLDGSRNAIAKGEYVPHEGRGQTKLVKRHLSLMKHNRNLLLTGQYSRSGQGEPDDFCSRR